MPARVNRGTTLGSCSPAACWSVDRHVEVLRRSPATSPANRERGGPVVIRRGDDPASRGCDALRMAPGQEVVPADGRATRDAPGAGRSWSRRTAGPFTTAVTFAHPDGRTDPWSSRRHRKHASRLSRARPGRERRPVGAAPRLLVDRGAVHRRLELLRGRAAARPTSTRVGGQADAAGVLRRVPVLHLRGVPAVAGDDQRRPGPAAAAAAGPLRVLAWEPRRIDWWSSGVQLLGTLFFNVTTFRALSTAVGARVVRPGRVAAGRLRLDLLPGVRVPRVRRGVRRAAAPRSPARSRACWSRSTCSGAWRSRSRPSRRTSCRPRATSSTSTWPTPPRRSVRWRSWSAPSCCCRRGLLGELIARAAPLDARLRPA